MGIGVSILIGFLAYLALAVGMQRSVMYPAPTPPDVSIADHKKDVESIWLGAEKNVEAWFLPAQNERPSPVVIFTHGNGELIDYWAESFETLRQAGVSVLLLEYPGYGRSGGKPTEESIIAAIIAAYDYLAAREDVDNKRVVAYGRSLGGGAACALAVQRDVAGLILESSFSGVRKLARRMAVPGFLVLDPFDNVSCIAKYDGPVLIMHGNFDQIIPVSHAKDLDSAAANSQLTLLACGHNDCPRPWAVVNRFLQDHNIIASAPTASAGR